MYHKTFMECLLFEQGGVQRSGMALNRSPWIQAKGEEGSLSRVGTKAAFGAGTFAGK